MLDVANELSSFGDDNTKDKSQNDISLSLETRRNAIKDEVIKREIKRDILT